MAEILRESARLFLRRAEPEDIDYICALQEAADNRDYIVPFSRADHETIILQGKAAIDLIVVEKETLVRVGYLHVGGLLLESKEQEWTHVVVEKKGCGYGHETMRLLKAWAFEVCGAERAAPLRVRGHGARGADPRDTAPQGRLRKPRRPRHPRPRVLRTQTCGS